MLLLTICGRVHKLRHQFHILVVLVNVYVQCTLIWKYIKCMQILSRILFVCYYVISTILALNSLHAKRVERSTLKQSRSLDDKEYMWLDDVLYLI